MEISDFTTDNMTPLVGTSWRLDAPNGQQYELELVQVLKTLDKHIDPRFHRDTFSLQFIGPPDVLLPQAMYPLTHEAIGGPHHIFIVPLARDPRGYLYEAVFT